jgi:hypothetical protein
VNNSYKIIALDPGVTTGYATGVIDNGKLGAVSGQARWNEYELFLQLEFAKPQIVVYERFDFRRGQSRMELFPRNLIGVICLYVQKRAAENDPVEVAPQMPVEGKNYYTDKVLKNHKMFKVGNPHANDAMRHLLHWFTFGSGYQYNTGGFEPLA